MIAELYNCIWEQKAIESNAGEDRGVLMFSVFAKVVVALNRVSRTRSDLKESLAKI